MDGWAAVGGWTMGDGWWAMTVVGDDGWMVGV